MMLPTASAMRTRLLAYVAVVLLSLLWAIGGYASGLERALRDVVWQMREKPASGELHIVEIDARSLAAIDRWPWPRSNHAILIDQLRSAGVASLAFDVDFSSQSSPAEDAALEAALRRSEGQVILPTFRQIAGGGQQGWTDSLPIPALRQHSLAAAVSIRTDHDGYVRRAPVGIITQGVPRPSLSAMIAGKAGSAGEEFPIDFAIDPSSIPRHSFIDIRNGQFARSALAGKHVLVGGTAVEMGDRYVVPSRGVLPGVVVQALAAETLMRGVPREAGWPLALLPAAIFAWIIVAARSRGTVTAVAIAGPLLLFITSLGLQTAANTYIDIAPSIILLMLATVVSIALRIIDEGRRRQLHDQETGLPNRRALDMRLRSGSQSGLIAAQIAEFDKLAASLGREGTCELIMRIRERLAHKDDVDLIYRIEDRVLSWQCDHDDEIRSRLATLRKATLQPFEVKGRRIDVNVVFGYATDTTGAPDRLVANAAFAAGRGHSSQLAWHVYQPSDENEAERELSMLGELDDAIARGQIGVYYQPKLDLQAMSIASVEALVRWHHPVRGFLPPDSFIPLAERNDRIADLTLYVLKQTLSDLSHWHGAGFLIGGAINVSVKLLESDEFLTAARSLLEAQEVDPAYLTFEVTESAAMRDPDQAIAALHTIKTLGIAISMDDYGTGQSSLSYLRELPLDELKIDRMFVQQAHHNASDAVLVRSTVSLGHELGLRVVAEGVEDEQCLTFLQSVGCDIAQGYYISRPVPAGAVIPLLSEQTFPAA